MKAPAPIAPRRPAPGPRSDVDALAATCRSLSEHLAACTDRDQRRALADLLADRRAALALARERAER